MVNAQSLINWSMGSSSHQSVYFYTFHRCSSTLFSKYVLKNIIGLYHIDYAGKLYKGKEISDITFESKGVVYGPIRLTAPHTSIEYTGLVNKLSDLTFIHDKIAIFLIRDPRDILVSSYYSFARTHSLSVNKEIREKQEAHRQILQTQTIDEYVLESAPILKNSFETLVRLNNSCGQNVIIRYEDMINNWEQFVSGLTRFVKIKQSVLDNIYEKTRPREFEDNDSHRRSGKPQAFREKLEKETISSLNASFKDILERFNYVESNPGTEDTLSNSGT